MRLQAVTKASETENGAGKRLLFLKGGQDVQTCFMIIYGD